MAGLRLEPAHQATLRVEATLHLRAIALQLLLKRSRSDFLRVEHSRFRAKGELHTAQARLQSA